MADRRRSAGSWPRLVLWVSAIAVTALATASAVELGAICRSSRGLPLWDLAYHGWAGVELAGDVRRGDLLGFLLAVNRQVGWPFVHSLMLLPCFLAWGDDYLTAERLSVMLFAATVIAVYAAGLKLHPTRGAWAGCLAASLVLLAPAYRLFGTLPMFEMPGAFWLALTLALHLRTRTAAASRALTIAAGLSTTALFLCKYNYGLMWIAPLALHEWLALSRQRRAELMARTRASIRSRQWVRPFPLFVLAFLSALIGILISGGGVFHLMGRRVSVQSPGNPAYALVVILSIWAWARLRRMGWRRAWRGLSDRHRILVATVVIPIWFWFLVPYPNRVREFFGFVVNRDSGQPLLSLENLLYYPRAFTQDYSPAPVVGWIVLLLALVPPRRSRTGGDANRLLYLALWFGVLPTLLHHYRDPRFLFTTALLIWLRAAQTVTGLAAAVLDRPNGGRFLREPLWVAGLLAALAWAWAGGPPAGEILAARRPWYSPPAFAAVLDRVLDRAAREPAGSRLLGISNWLNPGLVTWHASLTRPGMPRAQLPRRLPWLPRGASEGAIAERLTALKRSGQPVIAALPGARSPMASRAYREEIWADSVTAVRLSADPDVIVEPDVYVSGVDFRVRTFRFRSCVEAGVPPRGAIR
jgi:hypothetical protein